MQIVQTQIFEEGGDSPAIRVEFSGGEGEVISVFMRKGDDGELTRDTAVKKAQQLMVEMGHLNDNAGHGHPVE